MLCVSPAPRPRALPWLIGVAAAVGLCVACATGSSATDDDDDDGAGGGGGTSSGTTTATGSGGAGGTIPVGGSGSGGARVPTAGEVIFIELMPDPDQLSDSDAEYLELKNLSSDPIELGGCQLKDLGGDEVTIDGSVPVGPGQTLLFAKVDNPALNGNLMSVAFAFGTSFSLANSGDEAMLECSGQLIDQVAYTSDWPYDTGVSMQLRSDRQTATDNDSAANWCAATAAYAAGNLGTPGTDAGHCL